MKKRAGKGLVLLFALCCTGCSSQRVSTSTFLSLQGLQQAIAPGSRISVIPNEQVPNPIFDIMVKEKLEGALMRRGFSLGKPVDTIYQLRYAYDLMGQTPSGRSSFFAFPGAQGFYVTGSNQSDSYFGAGLGFGTFVNDPTTVYMAKLRLRLSRPVAGTPGQEEILWVGEAVADTDSPDIRKMMNYLIAALFRYFMQDSGETKTIKLSGKDGEVLAIAEGASPPTAV